MNPQNDEPPDNFIALAWSHHRLRETIRDLVRNSGSTQATVSTLRMTHQKLDKRVWHIAHNVSQIRTDMADITDDQTRIYESIASIRMEMAHIKGKLDRQVLLLEALVKGQSGDEVLTSIAGAT